MLLAAVMTQFSGCGDDQDGVVSAPSSTQASAPSTTAVPATTASSGSSSTAAARSYSAETSTADGYRYRITLEVGPRLSVNELGHCAPVTVATEASVAVTLTVANQSPDRPAPFPPLRIELAAGGAPANVMVQDPAGSCTFTPRRSQLGPGESAVFQGATPAIAEDAAPGTAGRVEVSISESGFSLSAPVP